MKPIAFVYRAKDGELLSIDMAPMMVLFGRSGSGKTSILRGLFSTTQTMQRAKRDQSAPGSQIANAPGMLVLRPQSEGDYVKIRWFITEVINDFYGTLIEPPNSEFDFDEIPWWEQPYGGRERWLASHNLELNSWIKWLSDPERWSRDTQNHFIKNLSTENETAAQPVIRNLIDNSLLGLDTDGSLSWICHASVLNESHWRQVKQCSRDRGASGFAMICRSLLKQRGHSEFLALCEISSMPRYPTSFIFDSINVQPFGSFFTASAEFEIEWHVAQALKRLGLGIDAIKSLQLAMIDNLPPFVRNMGQLTIEAIGEGKFAHVRVGIDSGGLLTPFSKLPSGARSWVAMALSLAVTELEINRHRRIAGNESPNWLSVDPFEVWLLDEPESHLDPQTQRETLKWIEAKVSESRVIVVASHSETFLNETSPDARLYGVNDGKVISMSHDLLGMVEVHADALGLGRAALLQSARSLLLVEGKHDVAVLQTMFRGELRAARILVIPIYGTGNAQNALTEVSFFNRLGSRLLILFDNTRRSKFQGDLPYDSERMEERILAPIVDALRSRGIPVEVLPYDKPDIICAIPSATVSRAFNGVSPDWDSLINAFRQAPKGNFKEFALNRLGLRNVQPSEFFNRCVAAWRQSDGRDDQLSQVIQDLTT